MQALIGALNGVLGDYLKERSNPLAIEMDFYYNGAPVGSDIAGHLATMGHQKDRSVNVFLHGSSDTEACWNGKRRSAGYGQRLRETLHQTPLYLRYNSGLHISENGKAFSHLMEKTVTDAALEDLNMICFSMGGLVFRSACYYAEQYEHQWIHKVRKVFYLGTPHLGAPLEKFGAWTNSILDRIGLPHTTIVSRIIGLRSAGIKDLRHGYITEKEWQADEADPLPRNNQDELDHLSTAQHYVVAGTWHSDTESRMSSWVGDMMVRKESALAAAKAMGLPREHILIVGGHHHIRLLNSRKVYEFLVAKMTGGTED